MLYFADAIKDMRLQTSVQETPEPWQKAEVQWMRMSGLFNLKENCNMSILYKIAETKTGSSTKGKLPLARNEYDRHGGSQRSCSATGTVKKKDILAAFGTLETMTDQLRTRPCEKSTDWEVSGSDWSKSSRATLSQSLRRTWRVLRSTSNRKSTDANGYTNQETGSTVPEPRKPCERQVGAEESGRPRLATDRCLTVAA